MSTSYNKDTGAEQVVQDLASHIKGKVILTTGVSPGGLGAAFVEYISKASPKLLILAARTPAKIEATAKKIAEIAPGVKTRVLKLDLASFKQVREAAAEVNAYSENIDVLVNNAGIMAPPYSKTEDGFESQLQSNHLSHFLFTNLIIDKILASGPNPRVVNVSSNGYRLGHIRYFDYNFHDGESYNRWLGYGQTKTANMLFSQELAKRLESRGLQSYSLHPGVIMTNLSKDLEMSVFGEMNKLDKQNGAEPGWWTSIPYVDHSRGTSTHVVAAFSPDLKSSNGGYLEYASLVDPDNIWPWAIGEREARKCWEWSEKLIGQRFQY